MNKDIGYLIKNIDDRLRQNANRDLETVGLTFSQIRVLFHLRHRESSGLQTSCKDIELILGVAHTTVLGLLKRLEAKGLIRTAVRGSDRRVRDVFLGSIEPGLWTFGEEHRKRAEKRILAGFSREEKAALRKALAKILANLA